jgi:hypothetical protein
MTYYVMLPFDCYKTYIAMKSHFTKDSYDYQRYGNRLPRLKVTSFYKRKDRFFFEKMSRDFADKEIEEFFVANFISGTDPQSVYMADIIKNGRNTFAEWQKRNQSLSYTFKGDVENIFEEYKVDDAFNCSKGHPPILKSYLGGDTSLESMVICDIIFGYGKDFDKRLNDPVWETVSRKIKKYKPFLNINVPRYKKILKEVVINGT